jgi:hypothetical protein
VLRVAVLAFAAAALACGGAETEARVAKARSLFERYVALEHAFDPALADLYSDDALIKNKRSYPNGTLNEVTLPAPKYKELLRTMMPVAKLQSDTSTYSDVKYTIEGDAVRITADRFSDMKKYHSPLSLLVKRSAGGEWLIYEELSESRP